ncbi:hypothetical protein BDZ45DRAFT_791253 [Acephala macrosclerotiorum]|nr:hypothetical protein BDZ45DRAFT_791253 [Acephala macrosclerotiorum]
MKSIDSDEASSELMELYGSCFDLSYWTRLWIIQELVLASKIVVQYSAMSFRWELLEMIFKTVVRIPAKGLELHKEDDYILLQSRMYSICACRSTHSTSATSVPLLDLFFAFQAASCMDTRDKVFGIHSLSKECCQRAVEVDYGESAPEVCDAVLEHHFRAHAAFNGRSVQMLRDALIVLKQGGG